MAKRVQGPSCRVGFLCWITWQVMENISIGPTCWLSRWKCMYPMSGIRQRISKHASSRLHTCLMQSVPINSFLAWVGHGHLQRMLWTYIATCSQITATEDSWLYYLTISLPLCTQWSLNKIYLACPRQEWRHCWTLKIGMPHLMEPSSWCTTRRKLCMCC